MTAPLPGWLTAAAVKATGMQLSEDATELWWRLCADAAIAELAQTRQPFTAYDLIAMRVPEPDKPCRWGPRFTAAAKAGLIEAVGYTSSRRPTTAKSAVRVWAGTPLASPETPDVGAVPEPGGRTFKVACPFCSPLRRGTVWHVHGNGGDDDRPAYGPRISHCVEVPARLYNVVPVVALAASA